MTEIAVTYLQLDNGDAALSIWFVILGARRQRANNHAIAERRYVGLKRAW